MATVKIPPVLRPSTGGEKEVSAGGESVGAVLTALAEQHPSTKSQLFGENGDLNRYVNVYLNDEDVRVLEGLETPVGEGDTLVIPIVEETAVVVKRLVVREEVRLHFVPTERPFEQAVDVRRQHATVERVPPGTDPPTAEAERDTR